MPRFVPTCRESRASGTVCAWPLGVRTLPAWVAIDYDGAWAPFGTRFGFRPDYHERERPAIRLPERALVVDLSPIYDSSGARFAAGFDAVNAAALRAFVWLAENDELVALDWQHECFRYSPAAQALSDQPWRITVAPDGDYYAHMTQDLRWGTFGHPWQQTLTIWGDDLIESLGTDLLAWLPRNRQSTA
jgi:hypothetical protein